MSYSSIPYSSQSAQVDEYVILWTADKHKKLKKWHDGYLRYHTFNKRLMVHDHLGNKVTDKFLPEDEPIDVGDELVFDSHLVTIEDIKGKQSQDLRPLFEKTVDRRNKAKEDAQTRERQASERPGTASSNFNTPLRRTGTIGPAGRTPSLLKTVHARPKVGGESYPLPHTTPYARVLETPPPPPAPVVPQKRTAQGTPASQKIVYEKFTVPRLPVQDPRPAQKEAPAASKIPQQSTSGHRIPTNIKTTKKVPVREQGSGGNARWPEQTDIESELLGSEDDFDMLELNLEKSDFSAISKQIPSKSAIRARPNMPPTFKPPLARKERESPKAVSLGNGSERTASITIDLDEPSAIVHHARRHCTSEKQPEHQSSPQTQFSSPVQISSRKSLSPISRHPRTIAPSAPPPVESRPVSENGHLATSLEEHRMPMIISSDESDSPPPGNPENLMQEIEKPKTLTLPSASSRSRRGLLCGLTSRGLASVPQPVSALKMYNSIPDDGFIVDSSQPVVTSKKAKTGGVDKPARKKATKVTKVSGEEPEKRSKAKKPSKAKADAESTAGTRKGKKKQEISKETISTDDEENLEPLPQNQNLSALGRNSISNAAVGFGGASQILKPPQEVKVTESRNSPVAQDESDIRNNKLPVPEGGGLKNQKRKEQKQNPLQIFSSDAEDENGSDTVPLSKVVKDADLAPSKSRPISLSPATSEDEFETLRLSGLPKHLVQESRNEKLLRQRLAETDNSQLQESRRVYHEDGASDMRREQKKEEQLKQDRRRRNLERMRQIQSKKDAEMEEAIDWSITPPERLNRATKGMGLDGINSDPPREEIIVDDRDSIGNAKSPEETISSFASREPNTTDQTDAIIISSQVEADYSTAAFINPHSSPAFDSRQSDRAEDEIIVSSQIEEGYSTALFINQDEPAEEDEGSGMKWPKTGPWTIEACDLFDWRPPDWKFEGF